MNDEATPLVSVVVPTYNHARYLGRALQSVLNQTYTNWEIIVIDNHSTDNTDEVMARFIDPRITYLKIHNNGIIAVSRNAGIRLAKGEWIAFLDSDDSWKKDKLKVCFEYMNDKIDLIYHSLEIVSEEPRRFSRKLIKSWQVRCPVIMDLLLNGNALATSSVVVRKKLLMQVKGMNENPNMVAAEDYNTWLKIANITNRFKFIPNALGEYFIHIGGFSQRDMSIPYGYAILNFTKRLSKNELMCVRTNINYIHGRYEYLNKKYITAELALKQCIHYCNFKISFKSIFMILVIRIRLLLNSPTI